MSQRKDERTDIKRKRKSSNERNKGNQKKNKKMVESDENDFIEKSKFWMKKGIKKKVTGRRQRSHYKVSINAKPMPSLSELEKMFEDSDNEDSSPSTSKEQTQNNTLSPETQHKIKDKIIDILTNDPQQIIDSINESTDIATQVVPVIVDCTQPLIRPEKHSTSVCNGHDDYGINSITIDLNDDDDKETPLMSKRRGEKMNSSNSVFTTQTAKIMSSLNECENVEASLNDISNDSTLTISYDADLSLSSPKRYTFAPLPSTSVDNETFLKNDQLFMASQCVMSTGLLENEPLNEVTLNESVQEDMKIIASFDNGSTQNKTSAITNETIENDIEFIEPSYETITIDDEPINNGPIDSAQIIDVDSYKPNNNFFYFNCSLNNSDCVIIDSDVDSVLEENKLLLENNKYLNDIKNFDLREDYNKTQEHSQNVECYNSDQIINKATISSILKNTSSPIASQPSVRNLGECSICMESLSSKPIASTLCGHIFCMQCIKRAVKTNGKKCPTCRKVLKGGGSGYHKLFL